ncbi:helix-turn-helix transcriptional regulator [uncultured Aquimarina sp.]|uniref:helix-turn-helix transcriptional regulator n=1 Tax=uncultured Aquimarina sp. TaxID=575652 RepID=UPI00261B87BD|nr:helix-turn-helix transcriptional regulator [uncultured Aquimarina sp.]
MRRYLILGLLFVIYNATGGLLPSKNFPSPLIVQYIITYCVAIVLCVFIIYYIYKEYDIVFIKFYFSIRNISILLITTFVTLFLLTFFITNSLSLARLFFTLPITLIGCYFLYLFYKELSKTRAQSSKLIHRRSILTFISISSVVLLPILTLIGDYQWLTFTIMNIAFYAITIIEVDRYLYFLEHKHKIYKSEVIDFVESNKGLPEPRLIFYALTPRELEIALSILDKKSYKKIAKTFCISEGTVSKHASNIFKKTGINSKREFLNKFGAILIS